MEALPISFSAFKLGISIVAAVILFLFSIDSFSREVQKVGGAPFRKLVSKWTQNRWLGAFVGAFVTAVVQSSSATSVIAVSLVNTGVLSFKQAISVIIGTNVGTTVTAQLVAFKLMGIGPYFIVLGFLLSLLRFRISIFGKAIFYFGFVFLSLDIISGAVEPLKANTQFLALIAQSSSPVIGIGLGALFTILVQSSSVTTGIAVILVQQGIINVEQGILLVLGSNIGTTFTSLITSLGMDIFAKRAAVGHLMFNVLGVILVLPLLTQFHDMLLKTGGANAGQILANAHLFFNVGAMVLFLLLIRPFTQLIEKIVRSKEPEITLTVRHLPEKAYPEFSKNEKAIGHELKELNDSLLYLLKQVPHWMKHLAKQDLFRAQKRLSFVDYVSSEINSFAQSLSQKNLTEEESQKIGFLIQRSFLIRESGVILGSLLSHLEAYQHSGEDFSSENLKLSLEAVKQLEILFRELGALSKKFSKEQYAATKAAETKLTEIISRAYNDALVKAQSESTLEGGVLMATLSLFNSLREKANSSRKYLKQAHLEEGIDLAEQVV